MKHSMKKYCILLLLVLCLLPFSSLALEKSVGESLSKTYQSSEEYLQADSSIIQSEDDAARTVRSGGFASSTSGSNSAPSEDLVTGTEQLISILFALCVVGYFVYTVNKRYQLFGSTYDYDYRAYGKAHITQSREDYIRTTTTRVRNPSSQNNGQGGGHGSGHGGGAPHGGPHGGGRGMGHGGR